MKTGFYSGDPMQMIQKDIPALKPTFFPSVPRIFNRIYAKIQEGLSNLTGCKRWLFDQAIASKLHTLRQSGGVVHPCYDALVFKRFKNMLGGHVKLMTTASAPLAAEVQDFLKVCFCCDFLEGYGMTETSGCAVGQYPGDPTSGHVGGPLASVKLRLKDVPEMGYLHTDNPPTGEIQFFSPICTPGYFRNEEKTKDLLDNGWISSGDIARVNPNLSITIIDRAKNIFKLSQGEYIAPEKLENVYI